jgi:hypothetical protein
MDIAWLMQVADQPLTLRKQARNVPDNVMSMLQKNALILRQRLSLPPECLRACLAIGNACKNRDKEAALRRGNSRQQGI